MRKIIHFAAITMITVIMVTPAQGIFNKVGQTGLQYLKADMSARSAAMGGASVMTANDATAMFSNPAGIAYISSGMDAFATNTGWIADIGYNAAGLVYSLGNLGTVGVNVVMVDYGDIHGTVVSSSDAGFDETGLVDASGLAIAGAYARQLTDKFLLGGQIRFASQHLGESVLPDAESDDGTKLVQNDVSGFSYEVGTIFYPGLYNSFRFGMSIKNFSSQYKFQEETFQLPLTFVIGTAVDIMEVLGMEGNNSLLLAIDGTHPRDFTERIHVGLEYTFMNMVSLRGGYKTNYDLEGLSLGGGVNLGVGGMNIKVDYSWSAAGVFDPINRFTVGFSF